MIICPTRSRSESDAKVLSTHLRCASVRAAVGLIGGAGIGATDGGAAADPVRTRLARAAHAAVARVRASRPISRGFMERKSTALNGHRAARRTGLLLR